MYELWGRANSMEELISFLQESNVDVCHFELTPLGRNSYLQNPCKCPDSSFKIEVDTFNKTLTKEQKLEKIHVTWCILPFSSYLIAIIISMLQQVLSVDELNFKGRVNLSQPQHTFNLFEFYRYDTVTPDEKPLQVYFGRWVRKAHYLFAL
jgi:hypothetical protein